MDAEGLALEVFPLGSRGLCWSWEGGAWCGEPHSYFGALDFGDNSTLFRLTAGSPQIAVFTTPFPRYGNLSVRPSVIRSSTHVCSHSIINWSPQRAALCRIS